LTIPITFLDNLLASVAALRSLIGIAGTLIAFLQEL
jgi:hypothetical protein